MFFNLVGRDADRARQLRRRFAPSFWIARVEEGYVLAALHPRSHFVYRDPGRLLSRISLRFSHIYLRGYFYFCSAPYYVSVRCERPSASKAIKARPVCSSVLRCKCTGDSTTMTSSVGRTWASIRWPPCAVPSDLPTTTWTCSFGPP